METESSTATTSFLWFGLTCLTFTFHCQTFDEHSEAVKAKDARIADLQSNLSAKEIELDVS